MSQCQPFQVHIEESPEEALGRVKRAASSSGVRFSGSTQEGNFSGQGVQGSYAVSGEVITIHITDLGFPASLMFDCKSLEAQIRKFFED